MGVRAASPTLPDILRNVSAETQRLTEMAERLDEVLAGFAQDAHGPTLQEVDHLRQSLAVMGQLVGNLASHLDQRCEEPAQCAVDTDAVAGHLRPLNIRDTFLFGPQPDVDRRDSIDLGGFLEL